jgi:hypothetical protein
MLTKYTVQQRPDLPDLQKLADETAADYFDVLETGMANHERSLQELIGPSEIGIPCQRALVHKLAKDPEPADTRPPWKPAVGTALHTQMEEWFGKYRAGIVRVEDRVGVGQIGDDWITGSTDLFWLDGRVGDHKFVGKTRLLEYKAKGPGPQYEVQAHTYGVGWAMLGYPVRIVLIFFVPRDGELKDSFVWWDQFRPAVAKAAMDNARHLYDRMQTEGKEALLEQFPLCQDEDPAAPAYNKDAAWCDWCKPARIAAILSNPEDAFDFRSNKGK